MVNPQKLHRELLAAGIPIHGVSSDGRIDFKAEASQAQRVQAGVILRNHDPNPTQDDRLKASYDLSDAIEAIIKALKENDSTDLDAIQSKREAVK